jgi:hypothetical protein
MMAAACTSNGIMTIRARICSGTIAQGCKTSSYRTDGRLGE